MKVTCGSFIIDKDDKILLCRATGSANDWTVPKGLLENHELPHMAAKRELKEETGIDIMNYPHKMYELGISPYPHKNKIIAGFLFQLEGVIEQELYCESVFTDLKTGKKMPEVDLYVWVPIKYAISYMRPEQVRLLRDYYKSNKKGE